MPLVQRKITEEIEGLYTKQTNTHIMYVAPRAKLPGDVVVPIESISDEQLKDLAITHPNEYGKAAAARDLSLEIELPEDEEEFEPEIEFTPDQEAFLALGDDEALAQIAATDDPEELASYIDAEQKSAAPRRAILTAIGNKG